MDRKEIDLFANEIRRTLVHAISSKGGGHIGGSLSICDLVAVLYGEVMRYDPQNPQWKERDYLVCSKGHCAPAIYSALALKGFFPMEWLKDLNKGGTHLPGHSDRMKVPGIDATTGSLGQGLSIACGLAHAIKISDNDQFVYCITGDGENDEGQIWEAAMYAAHHELSHLIMFLDWNKKQIDGSNEQVMKLFDPVSKYREFGWESHLVDGSDTNAIFNAIINAKNSPLKKPTVIVLDTVKGAGIPDIEAMENNHCIGFPKELAEKCWQQLDAEKVRINNRGI